MRIISIRFEPVARVLCIIYAAFGFVDFIQFAFSDAPYMTLPLGILAPLVYLNINLKFPRSTNLLYNILFCFAYVIAYGITGWATGAAAAVCFNFVA